VRALGGFEKGSEARPPDELLCVPDGRVAGHLMLRAPEANGEAEGGTTPSDETVTNES